jgi:small-conductance mechanosensitive channel
MAKGLSGKHKEIKQELKEKREEFHQDLREKREEIKSKLEDKLQDIKEELPKYWVLNRIMLVMLVVFLLLETMLHLNTQGIVTFPQQVIQVAAGAVLVILSLLLASAFIRLTENWLFKLIFRGAEIEQTLFFKKLYGLGVYFFAIAFILFKFGVSLSNITLFAGLVASGVAFAIRDVILSYLIWFILLTKKPFRIGDYIKIGDDSGKVLHIGTFYVIVDSDEQIDSQIIRIPNSRFLTTALENYGKEGVYLDRARIQFKGVPEDFAQRVARAEQTIAKLTDGKGQVYLESYNEYICLVAQYPVRFSDRHEMKKRVILTMAKG